MPLNAPGVSIWSRKPYEKYAVSEFDNPLATRFDENDAAVLFENVKVPWELSRCQHFTALGQAYWLTGDERYAREFVDGVHHSIHQVALAAFLDGHCRTTRRGSVSRKSIPSE